VVLDGGALAGESATEEGPQKGIQDRRHPIDMCARRGPDGPARRVAGESAISDGRRVPAGIWDTGWGMLGLA
jgi:hypothetical protein